MSLNGRVVDKPTRYANRLRFKVNELNHMIRILEAMDVNPELIKFYQKIRSEITKRGRLIPGGEYEVVLDAYHADVEETLKALIKAKTGITVSISDIVKQQQEQGKAPFEV